MDEISFTAFLIHETRTMSQQVDIKTKRSGSSYRIRFAGGALSSPDAWDELFAGRRGSKVAIVSNRKVSGLYGERLVETLEKGFGVKTHVHLIGDGERHKTLKTLADVLSFLGRNEFTRTDAMIALGGGVVGDVSGFAASVYLRGIRFIQAPTTLLAMIDSSVGGKTGVNTPHGKNTVGSFYQPAGVVADVSTLRTLPRREVTAGFCEAVKQAAIGGTRLFDQTRRLLEGWSAPGLRTQLGDGAFADDMERFLKSQVEFKASVVRSDEREDPANTGVRSRKILNFGHTLAHALERATDYKYLRHGEAVGYGILFAAELSKRLELIDEDEVSSLNDVVHRCGVLPPIDRIPAASVFDSLKYDKKNIGQSLQWILLRSIGDPAIIPQAQIPRSAMTAAYRQLVRK